MLSPSTISFELHAKMAEEINLEKVHFSQLRKLRDLDLDLGSGRGHIDAHYLVEVYPHTK